MMLLLLVAMQLICFIKRDNVLNSHKYGHQKQFKCTGDRTLMIVMGPKQQDYTEWSNVWVNEWWTSAGLWCCIGVRRKIICRPNGNTSQRTHACKLISFSLHSWRSATQPKTSPWRHTSHGSKSITDFEHQSQSKPTKQTSRQKVDESYTASRKDRYLEYWKHCHAYHWLLSRESNTSKKLDTPPITLHTKEAFNTKVDTIQPAEAD